MRPVPGWDAIRNDLKMQVKAGENDRYVESYIVLRCPLFTLEEHYRWAYERFDPDHARDKGGKRISGNRYRHKKVRCLDTGIVYPSVKEASAKTGSTEYTIRAACTGLTQKTKDGTRWEYVQEEKHE